VDKPIELAEAEMIYGLCQSYSSLPEQGAVMDQPVWVLRMHGILSTSGYFGDHNG
jgi:hypothetical protein